MFACASASSAASVLFCYGCCCCCCCCCCCRRRCYCNILLVLLGVFFSSNSLARSIMDVVQNSQKRSGYEYEKMYVVTPRCAAAAVADVLLLLLFLLWCSDERIPVAVLHDASQIDYCR